MISQAFHYPVGGKISQDFPLFYNAKNLSHLWVIKESVPTGQQIVSHAGSFTLSAYIDGMKVLVGGIGGVASVEKYRGKGYAKALIQKCLEDLHGQGAALACLWSGEHDFYRAMGFELVGRQWSIVLPQAQKVTLLTEAQTLAAEVKAPLDQLKFLEGNEHIQSDGKKLLDKCPLRCERSQKDFNTLMEIPGARVFALKQKGDLLAYCVVGKGMDLQNHIHEWATKDELSLLYLLYNVVNAHSDDLVLLSPQFTPEEAPLIYRLEKLKFQSSPGFMSLMKILHFDKIRDLVVQKAKSLAMESSFLRLEKMEDGNYCVGWATDPDAYFNEAELLRFLFGPQLPSEQVALEHNSQVAFDSLLPLRLWWWGLDSV